MDTHYTAAVEHNIELVHFAIRPDVAHECARRVIDGVNSALVQVRRPIGEADDPCVRELRDE